MSDPLVTIIIPSHNRPHELIRAVNSVLSQTWTHVEVIVIDDASTVDMTPFTKFMDANTQGTPSAALPFPQNRVTWIRLTESKGACHARNIGLHKASGEYINFLDDDDEVYPDKIEKQLLKFAHSKDPDLAVVTSHMVDARSGEETLVFNHHTGRIYPEILGSWLVKGIHTSLFKKEFLLKLDGFDEGLESNQEYDLMIRLMERYAIDYVDEALCIAHRSRDQISLNFGKKRRGARYLFQKHSARFKAEGVLFFMTMWIKYQLLYVRFWSGQYFGEAFYRRITPK